MKKDLSIESLRGLAVILVVGGHITGDGLIDSAREFYEYMVYSFQYVRLPLFTVISGFLYGLRPVSEGEFVPFFKGKSRRILLPLLFVASCEFLAKSLVSEVNDPQSLENVWRVWVFGYHHYWFLQVILILFVLMGLLGHFGWRMGWTNWSFLFLMSGAVYFVFPATGLSLSVFSLGASTYLLPFFIFGIGLAQHSERLLQRKALVGWCGILLLAVIYQQAAWFTDLVTIEGRRPLIGFFLALSACAVLFKFRVVIPGLAIVGSYAYSIYLFQGFGTSLGRRIITDVGPHTYFVLLVLFTLIFGMAVEIVGRRIPFVRTPLLGLK